VRDLNIFKRVRRARKARRVPPLSAEEKEARDKTTERIMRAFFAYGVRQFADQLVKRGPDGVAQAVVMPIETMRERLSQLASLLPGTGEGAGSVVQAEAEKRRPGPPGYDHYKLAALLLAQGWSLEGIFNHTRIKPFMLKPDGSWDEGARERLQDALKKRVRRWNAKKARGARL
jgi:hypothetical protein